MRRKAIVMSLLIVSCVLFSISVTAKQYSLLDKAGASIAYIDTDNNFAIYLWSGKPVAYLDGNSIYGFNGKHLGWFSKGVIWSNDGDAVGYLTGVLPITPQLAPLKGLQQFQPIKAIEEIAPLQPIFRGQWSQIPLIFFLAQGASSYV